MNLFELKAVLGMDTSEFEQGVSKSQGLMSKMGKGISASTVAMGNLMAKGIEKGVNAIMDLGKTGIAYNAQMEDYTTNFSVMLGSTEAAAAKVESLKEMAAKTPFEMADLAAATQTLLAFGIEAENTDGIMKMLGDVSLGNSQKFSSLATVFGQVSSTGKLMGQDLNQFINQGFNPLQVIAEKTGASVADLKNVMGGTKTSREFNKMVKAAQKEVKKMGDGASESAKMLAQIGTDGAISAEMVTKAFEIATSEGGQFFNGMEEASKTYNGMMATLSDNWTSLVGKVFEPVSDFMKEKLLPGAIGVVDKLSEAYDSGGLMGMANEMVNIVGPMLTSAFESVQTAAQNAADTGANVIANIYNGLTGSEITGDDVKGYISGVFDEAAKTVSTLADAGANVLGDIYTAMTGNEEAGQKITETIKSVFEDPKGAIDSLVSGGKTIFTDIYGALSGDAAAQQNINNLIGGVFETARGHVDSVATQAGAIFGDIVGVMTGDTQNAELIKSTFASVFDDPKATLESIVSKGGSLISDIATAFGADEESAASIGKAFTGIWTDPLGTLDSILQKGGSLITDIATALGLDEESATTIGEAFANVFSDPLGTVQTLATQGAEIIGKITEAFTSEENRLALLEGVKGAFQDIIDFISGLPGMALEWGKGLIQSFVDGLVAKWEELKSTVSGLFGGITGMFGFGGGSGEGKPHAVGLDYVPYNNYSANLHRGEAVLTRTEAEAWRSGKNARGSVTVNQYIYAQEQTAAELMQEAVWQQERAVLYGV